MTWDRPSGEELENIYNIPVTGIGTGAFQDQPLLVTVVIGDTHEKIMDWAFSYCPKLKEVIIEKSVAMIGTARSAAESYALANRIHFLIIQGE